MLAKREANRVFPVPGGPLNNNECPPAAAISRARRGRSWPLTWPSQNYIDL